MPSALCAHGEFVDADRNCNSSTECDLCSRAIMTRYPLFWKCAACTLQICGECKRIWGY